MNYIFNSGDTSSIATATIITSEPIRINSITLNGINTSDSKGSVTITITDGTDSTNRYSGTIEVDSSNDFSKSGNDVTFTPSFTTTNRDASITISVSRTRATVYGGATRDNEKNLAGLGAYISSGSMFNCTITAELVRAVWRKGESGYVELVQNPYIPWEDWQRDGEGYPHNPSVYKVDGNNYGFPWIWGFEPYTPPESGRVLINTAEGYKTAAVYINTESGLVPVSMALYINTESGLVPVRVV